MSDFRLSDAFIKKYQKIKPPFGFNGLGELVYYRTYSRVKESDGKNEVWWETVRRVVEGTYNMQKKWIDAHGLGWNPWKSQKSAQEMYDRIFTMKFLPPGRGLWAMGTAITEERGLYAALNNCSFVSTENIKEDGSGPFCFLMDMSMLGVGVGFDTKGSDKIFVRGPNPNKEVEIYTIPDTREGWVESVKRLIDSYLYATAPIEFDYSIIRAKGAPIKVFGGVSSGYVPLKELHEGIRVVLDREINDTLRVVAIVDIMNMIGKCVVAGNVRRTAEIVFGDPYSDEYLDLKNYEKNPERESFGWTSNNSIFADIGMDYGPACERVRINGEPGFAWLENMRGYSRMDNGPDHKDHRVMGGNPCFTGDTLIGVADGRGAVPIKQLAEEGVDVPVYTLNVGTGLAEIKWGRAPRLTREDSELVEVVLDDDTSIKCTPDHNFILRDGTKRLAKDLKRGDSLARMTKLAERISSSSSKKYLRMYCNVREPARNKIFEHRLIAKFYDPETKEALYDETKQNGWVKGGLVVHHKDYNSLNNRPENLEWMTFRDHQKFHAERDNEGENNAMYGRTHSKQTKSQIGKKSKENWDNRKEEMVAAITAGMQDEKVLNKISETTKKTHLLRNLENAKDSGLDTVIIDGSLFVSKKCLHCGGNITTPWRKRAAVVCSDACHLEYITTLDKRTENLKEAFVSRQQNTLDIQINTYNTLRMELNRPPLKKEWEAKCRGEKVPFRIRTNYIGNNPHVLTSYADLKERAGLINHKVKAVRPLSERQDVYNITTDDNHTIALVTKFSKNLSCSGIYTYQCLEQSLESYELCCLVENFPARHETLEDFKKTLKYAYLYAKTVTLGKTHWPETNRVLLRNRRIGCSVSGVAQFITNRSLGTLKKWLTEGYDELQRLDQVYSDWMAVPRSIKTTSVKPSGTVSLLAGATPGLHYPEARFYLRRVRVANNSPLLKPLSKAGYIVEPAFGSEDSTSVVTIPVDVGEGIRTAGDISIWEQMALAAFLQRYWSSNQVSCTVTFDPDTEGDQIKHALDFYQYQLKGISFLPRKEQGAYKQMPYESIDEETYEAEIAKLKPIRWGTIKGEEAEPDKFCDGESCAVSWETKEEAE